MSLKIMAVPAIRYYSVVAGTAISFSGIHSARVDRKNQIKFINLYYVKLELVNQLLLYFRKRIKCDLVNTHRNRRKTGNSVMGYAYVVCYAFYNDASITLSLGVRRL